MEPKGHRLLFSTATGYALRTLAAMPEDGRFTLSKDLAERLGLPGPYLAKILQALVQKGLLESIRGPKGGFRLARPTHQISVSEVVASLEGPDALRKCAMGFALCGQQGSPCHPCPFHDPWMKMRALMEASMTQVSIRDLKGMRLEGPTCLET